MINKKKEPVAKAAKAAAKISAAAKGAKSGPAIRAGTGKELAVRQSSPAPANLPGYLQQSQGTNRGSEEVQTTDIILPRLEIVQSTSDVLKKDKATFNEDARAGMMMNTLTGELFDEPVRLIDTKYLRQYLVWIDRKAGGGFRGAFDTVEQAEKIAEAQEEEAAVVATPQHLCLMLHQSGRLDEIVVSLPRTKEKVNRKWNSLSRLEGGDRFARVYELKVVAESNKKGDYHNFSISLCEEQPYPAEEQFALAEKLYNDMTQGIRKFTVQQGDFTDGPDSETDPNPEV